MKKKLESCDVSSQNDSLMYQLTTCFVISRINFEISKMINKSRLFPVWGYGIMIIKYDDKWIKASSCV